MTLRSYNFSCTLPMHLSWTWALLLHWYTHYGTKFSGQSLNLSFLCLFQTIFEHLVLQKIKFEHHLHADDIFINYCQCYKLVWEKVFLSRLTVINCTIGIVLCCSLCYFWQNGNCFLNWNGEQSWRIIIILRGIEKSFKELQLQPRKKFQFFQNQKRATDYFPLLVCTF